MRFAGKSEANKLIIKLNSWISEDEIIFPVAIAWLFSVRENALQDFNGASDFLRIEIGGFG
jgi:hypothetical protein